ncbi:cupin domain-containing protein [Alteribacillus iranensis]|uniref:Cupin domain-containing protein n=1 Tax=Alteribacillus iranensis TaxID=930128 RepID=A0A1I2DKX8_9BACI|nr:cupin domain-containing protein [Alteribacillus iranensis]SFE81166.1 Cupin domain-containing protein [Alteribacillus iranensis]
MIKNIRDYQEFDESTFTKKDIETEGTSKRFVLNFNPGQILPAHKHPNTQLFLTVIEGSGRLFHGLENYTISANDIIQCSGDETISIENNKKERLSVYVIMTSI